MKVHLIGIAGTGMGALARLLREAGHDVRGSDTGIYPPMSEQLAAAGIPVAVGYGPENLAWDPESVVVGNVCSADHPEVLAAQARGLPLESFPSMLARALLPGRDSLVVAGTHGKTTTTSLVAWLLRVGGLDPSFLVGGVPLNFGAGAHLGRGRPIVIEGDEYDTAFFDKGSKFLHYKPKRAILTSVEYDHVDIFPDFAAVERAFTAFVQTIAEDGDLIVHADDEAAMAVAQHARCTVLPYRVVDPRDPATQTTEAPETTARYVAVVLEHSDGRRTAFEVFEDGHSLGTFSSLLVGRYNMGNILAAIAMARREGIAPEVLRGAVLRFRGVKKRQELVGIAEGVRVFDDFAHHPTAVDLTLRALRRRYPDHALHVCFEPRSSSSRRNHFQTAYAGAFEAASAVFIAPVFRPEKVPEHERLDPVALARDIAARGLPARAFDSIEALADAVLERAVPGDTIVQLSSGDFGGLARKLLFGFGDPVLFATPSHRPAVQELLEGYGLPGVVPSDEIETFVMLGADHAVIGSVSLQVCGTSSFLFGLAVAPQRRGQGLGWVLGDIVLRRARTLGATSCYLITNTATDFFAGKLGFAATTLDAVDPVISETTNFQTSAGLPGAVCMVLPLTALPGEL